MSQFTGVANRYAQALYDGTKHHEAVLNQMRALEKVFSAKEFQTFLNSKTIAVEQKAKMIGAAIQGKGLAVELENFLYLLVEKNRLTLVGEILKAFEALVDSENGATRGEVRSATPLDAESRARIEGVISKVTKKRVILNYVDDQKLVGGILAKVGGWTFEDSLSTHLKRLNEELKRRAN